MCKIEWNEISVMQKWLSFARIREAYLQTFNVVPGLIRCTYGASESNMCDTLGYIHRVYGNGVEMIILYVCLFLGTCE